MIWPFGRVLTVLGLVAFTACPALAINRSQMQAAMRSRLCPRPPQKVNDLDFNQICAGRGGLDLVQCQNRVVRENAVIYAYNAFIESCTSGLQRTDRSGTYPAPRHEDGGSYPGPVAPGYPRLEAGKWFYINHRTYRYNGQWHTQSDDNLCIVKLDQPCNPYCSEALMTEHRHACGFYP